MTTVKEVAEALSADMKLEISDDDARGYLARNMISPEDWLAERARQQLSIYLNETTQPEPPPPPPEVADKYLDAWLPPQDAAEGLS